MKYRWQVANPPTELVTELAGTLGASALLARCLVNRKVETTERAVHFLDPRLKTLADPFLIPEMGLAVDRLSQARERRERLVIFGDYDVDGVCATTLLVEVMTALGWLVQPYLPHRRAEGYGLSMPAVERCLATHPVSLLLAVDCGSTSVETIESLSQRGVDVIVLDHHLPGEQLPPAVALVNPHRDWPGAPAGQELCAAGLAFKLAHALVKRAREANWPGAANIDLRQWLDLVALATIADLVPLTGENRILVKRGIERLNQTERLGLQALKRVADCSDDLGSYEVGFQLGPRLNAAGRLETAQDALRLLMSRTTAEADELAQRLDAQNRDRQAIQRQIADRVIGDLRAKFDPGRDYVIVEGADDWHIGVVGIVASRVVQEFHRPAVILGGCGEEVWRGSGRSIAGFDLGAALGKCKDWIVQGGGHSMAAGLSMLPSNVGGLREELNRLAQSVLLPEQLQPLLALDAEVSLAQLTVGQIRELEQLAITGMGNPAVQLCVRGVRLACPPQRVGAAQQHLKMRVTDGRSTADVVWWGGGEAPVGTFDLACAPQLNEYRGVVSVQLKLLDYVLAGHRLPQNSTT